MSMRNLIWNTVSESVKAVYGVLRTSSFVRRNINQLDLLQKLTGFRNSKHKVVLPVFLPLLNYWDSITVWPFYVNIMGS